MKKIIPNKCQVRRKHEKENKHSIVHNGYDRMSGFRCPNEKAKCNFDYANADK